MTERQMRFCDFYAKGATPKEAAVKSGYGEKNAAATGKRLLERKEVKQYLLKKSEAAPALVADNNEILSFLTAILRSEDESVAVRDKMRAAELLGKNLALFSDSKDALAPVVIYGEKEMKDV